MTYKETVAKGGSPWINTARDAALCSLEVPAAGWVLNNKKMRRLRSEESPVNRTDCCILRENHHRISMRKDLKVI